MKNIGITGGIGSGKSFICNIFESLGYRVYYADQRAKILMIENPSIIKGVTGLFGEKAYHEDGSLNRAFIGQIVFQDEKKLKALNAIVHPQTALDYQNWVQATPESYNKPFVLKEAAILYESGADRGTDAAISVYAPKNIRLQRVIKRDKSTKESVLARMDKQWSEWEKYRRAEFIIINDSSHMLLPQIRNCIQHFSK